MSKIIVVGAGINGVTSAIELKKRGHKVVLVDPGPLPHPLAASTDISKAVRAAYGPDEDFTVLADRCIELWRKWNTDFGIELYHQSGVLFVCQNPMQPGDFEYESCRLLEKHGHRLERFDSFTFHQRFPAFAPDRFQDGFFDPDAGYVESGRVVATLLEYAKSRSIELREGKFTALDETDDRVSGIVLEDRHRISGDAVVMAAGAWTPYLLPFTQKFFRASGFSFAAEAAEFFPAGALSIFRSRYLSDRLLRFSAKSGSGKNCKSRTRTGNVSRFFQTRGHTRRRVRFAQISKIDNPGAR